MMTEYADLVAKRRHELAAEEWGNSIKDIHGFDTTTTSMWYETRPEDGRVMDIRFNNGMIERHIASSGTIIQLGKKLTKQELIDAYGRQQAN
tara:strand:- start:513 stop:788 length:276 start_codon:yes stop_codon:yes gene_type:complete